MRHLALTLVALSFLTVTARADVLVVSRLGPADFTTIADAVAAAAPGDVLLLRPGAYVQPLPEITKPLTLVSDGSGQVRLFVRLEVSGIASNETFVVAGLSFLDGFTFEDSAGTIEIQDCGTPLGGSAALPPNLGLSGHLCGAGLARYEIRRCDRSILTDCFLLGRDGEINLPNGSPGEHGLLVEASTVLLYDCILRGGDGGQALWGIGHGAVYGGAGGDGLHLEGSPSNITHDRLQTTGGAGAIAPSSDDVSGCHGEDIRGQGQVNAFNRPIVNFDAPRVIYGAEQANFLAAGPAGSLVLIASARTPGWRPLGAVSGNLLVGNPLRFSIHGPIPPSGSLAVTVPMFDLPTPQDSVPFFFQGVVLSNVGRLVTKPQYSIVVHQSL